MDKNGDTDIKPIISPVKRIGASSIAAIVTAGLFLTMSGLVAEEGVIIDKRDYATFDDVIFKPKERPPIKSDIPDVKEPDIIETPPIPDPRPNPKDTRPDIVMPYPPGKPPIDTDFGPNINRPDGDMVVIAAFPARYPVRQAAKGTEGYVIISLTVNEMGQVENPKVIESEPTGAFDKAALKAITRFKYKPRISNGTAMAVHNVLYKMTFELED